MRREGENNLISINEIIFRAKSRGVDFGQGNPKERLRYLTKLGLLPHAKRKSFNGRPPNGAYPEYVIELLVEIDKEIKAGKSIQEIKREKEEKGLLEVPPYISPPILEVPRPKIKLPKAEKEIKKISFRKITNVLKIIFLVLVFSGLTYFLLNSHVGNQLKANLYSSLLASFSWVQKLVQVPAIPVEELPKKEFFSLPRLEPYLTINAETTINAPLNVKEMITAPALTFSKGEFKAILTTIELSSDRTYTFPNLSGTVCLTTGNCIGLGGEVFSPGGEPNRLAKFITSREIGVSSIEDFYLGGVALTIDTLGNIGIGTARPRGKLDVAGELITTGNIGIGIERPAYPLHVRGRIQATGDVCTDLGGGKCLSELAPPSPPIFFGGVGGSGTSGYLPIWTAAATLGNSIVSQIGNTLNVAGTVQTIGFRLGTSAISGYILTADASGFGTWQPAPISPIPAGLAGQTLRHDGTQWVANYFLYNTGSAIGIGTTSTPATLTLSGNAVFATTTLPQLILKYNDDNYLSFEINDTEALIKSSKSLSFNSLTGEIKFWETSIKKGEYILRSSIPIFKFPIAAQTTSTEFIAVTREISTSTLKAALPNAFPGAQRKFAFLMNLADDIPTTASSSWLVDLTNGTDIEFSFVGQNLPQLDEGLPHLSNFITPPENNWQLKVKVPPGNTIRIFNIFLLVFDQIQ